MSRFVPVDPAHAEGRAASLLAAVKSKLGVVPNMTRHMARSPSVLAGYLGLAGALGEGSLGAQLRERIALTTAEANACEYCLSAHSFIGKAVGLDAAEIAAARDADATDEAARAALRFARAVIDAKGHVSDDDVRAVRAAGFDDGAVGEIVANVALNVFTNYFNSVTRPQVDFPAVKPRAEPVAA